MQLLPMAELLRPAFWQFLIELNERLARREIAAAKLAVQAAQSVEQGTADPAHAASLQASLRARALQHLRLPEELLRDA